MIIWPQKKVPVITIDVSCLGQGHTVSISQGYVFFVDSVRKLRIFKDIIIVNYMIFLDEIA